MTCEAASLDGRAARDGDAAPALSSPRDRAAASIAGTGVSIAHPGRVAALLVVGSVLLGAVCVGWIDGPVARYALTHPPGIRAVAQVVTAFGLSGYMLVGAALIGLVATLLGRRTGSPQHRDDLRVLVERAGFVFGVVAISGILVQVAKHLVGRARPRLDAVDVLHLVGPSIKASVASLPSGHTTSIFALAVALGLMFPRWSIMLAIPALLVAASRTLVGAHYVSDVVAGAALGTLVTLIMAMIFARRGLAFTRVDDRLFLRGLGRVRPALLAALRPDRVVS